jgi:hypothetical protein
VKWTIDIVILSRHAGALRPEVERGLRDQNEVELVLHRVIGAPNIEDRARCDVIARARNEGKRRGESPWLMFLDDDVVLGPKCVVTLVEELERQPSYASLGADYLGERRFGRMARHVSLGATLFRREALNQFEFSWRGERCECQCCCDDLRRLQWRIDYSASALAYHLPQNAARIAAAGSRQNPETITCLCVTSGRVELLKKSVQCFLDQTYSQRELFVVHDPEDKATCKYLAGIKDSMVQPIVVPEFGLLPLGALRNISLKMGTGNYVATWDDDDWSHPARLEKQMRVIHETGLASCALKRLTLYDCESSRGYLSGNRAWENTLIAERSVLHYYPNVAKGEDTPVVQRLVHDGQLTMLDAPELYVYTYHGQNTWGREHWERLVRFSKPLGDGVSRQISSLIDAPKPRISQPAAEQSGRRNQLVADPFALNRVWSPRNSGSYALTAGALGRMHNQAMNGIGD